MPRILNLKRLVLVAAVAAASTSCGDVVRDGRSPMLLVINLLQASRGATSPGTLSGTLTSDTITNVTSPAPCTAQAPCATVFGDSGQVILSAALKDIGPAATPAAPTTNNQITINRYHVAYVRADGRNTEGVDVPYAFDGAVTGTVLVGTNLTLGFELVRNVAKEESPLVQLDTSGTNILCIAQVTFYGQDLVGNEISVTGNISIEFGNFGDF
jgi:hypothetical protein